MFEIAILIGIYSNLVLALGLIGFLHRNVIVNLTIICLLLIIYIYKEQLKMNLLKCFETFKRIQKYRRGSIKRNLLFSFLLSILLTQMTINFVGALGRELGFDALWYHLTIPKIYLENHSIFFIPGGLLYYSAMPKLTEMLYTASLAVNGEILAKLLHFSFGILSCVALYKLSREFLSSKISLIAVVIFYSNLVVGWQSITAYVDLTRTFFEVMALWGFVKFWKERESKWLIESAVMLGLAISTKLLALGSLLIFTILFMLLYFLKSPPRRSPFGHLRGVYNLFIWLFVYWIIGILISLPWVIFSFVHTGNPIYPFFTDIYKVGVDMELISPLRFLSDVWNMFTQSADPISPVYIIFLPLVILFFFINPHPRPLPKGEGKRMMFSVILVYSLFALIVWYFTPRTGGGRFILPYLPAFSIVTAGVVEKLRDLRAFLVIIIIFVSIISIFYRGAANFKYVPVILGMQKKDEFLSENLNFSFGDFYDTDGYFKTNIKQDDKVLLYGFHNLYYVDFPYFDSSWVKKGDSFNYIATQNSHLPKRFSDWELVYQNSKTNVKVYSKGGIKWSY